MTPADLLSALQSAPGAQYVLDIAIAEMVGTANLARLPCYTSSIDAALTLVPEGWDSLRFSRHSGGVGCFLDARDTFAPTPALALCIAALKARAS